jgi:hypothetical protein
VKPGDQTSIQGLRDIIAHQLIPVFRRSKAVYRGASSYYQKNPFKNDAMTVVPGEHPLDKFGLKDVNSAQPGDPFIDPQTGNLRWRPE